MSRSFLRHTGMALLLWGSAVLSFSCEKNEEEESARYETLMTEYSENLTLLVSENGRRSFHFTTPLLEGYTLAKEPYREFRKGVKIITYQDDSLSTVDAVLTANYAINYDKRRLWEAKGNVVVKKTDGRTLYTEQLFWNQLTGRIYSNVDTRLVQKDGADDFMSTGFESDEDFSFYNFREMDGKTEVELPEPGQGDSVSSRRRESPAGVPSAVVPGKSSGADVPVPMRPAANVSRQRDKSPSVQLQRTEREPASRNEARKTIERVQSDQKQTLRSVDASGLVLPQDGESSDK